MVGISWLIKLLGGIVPGDGVFLAREFYEELLHAKESIKYHNGCGAEIEALRADLEEKDRELSAERRARVQAESHVNSLREQLDFTREMLTDALSFEREGIKGLQHRLGLIAQPAAQPSGETKPVRQTMAPWSTVQRGLERRSAELARKDGDERAAHWTRKIKEVEQKDQEISGGSTAENSEIQRDLDDLN